MRPDAGISFLFLITTCWIWQVKKLPSRNTRFSGDVYIYLKCLLLKFVSRFQLCKVWLGKKTELKCLLLLREGAQMMYMNAGNKVLFVYRVSHWWGMRVQQIVKLSNTSKKLCTCINSVCLCVCTFFWWGRIMRRLNFMKMCFILHVFVGGVCKWIDREVGT